MSRLMIPDRYLNTIRMHAASSYPQECCGVLIGRSEEASEQGGRVERVLAAPNEHGGGRERRFLIGPRTVLAAQKEARAVGLEIVGYYHSHPDHPARPSELDRENAWPGVSYLIASVVKGRVVDFRSWRLRDDRSGFREEPLYRPGQDLHQRPDADG